LLRVEDQLIRDLAAGRVKPTADVLNALRRHSDDIGEVMTEAEVT
jgi:hypothetical protein